MYIPVTPVLLYKKGLRGSKLYRHVFVMVARHSTQAAVMAKIAPGNNKVIKCFIETYDSLIVCEAEEHIRQIEIGRILSNIIILFSF